MNEGKTVKNKWNKDICKDRKKTKRLIKLSPSYSDTYDNHEKKVRNLKIRQIKEETKLILNIQQKKNDDFEIG